jgi:hypothetical protein
VTVYTAHKILISSAIALFVFYAGWEARHAIAGDGQAWLRAGASAIGAVGFAVYLRSVLRRGEL